MRAVDDNVVRRPDAVAQMTTNPHRVQITRSRHNLKTPIEHSTKSPIQLVRPTFKWLTIAKESRMTFKQVSIVDFPASSAMDFPVREVNFRA